MHQSSNTEFPLQRYSGYRLLLLANYTMGYRIPSGGFTKAILGFFLERILPSFWQLRICQERLLTHRMRLSHTEPIVQIWVSAFPSQQSLLPLHLCAWQWRGMHNDEGRCRRMTEDAQHCGNLDFWCFCNTKANGVGNCSTPYKAVWSLEAGLTRSKLQVHLPEASVSALGHCRCLGNI